MRIKRTDTSFTIDDFKINPKYRYGSYTRNDNDGPRTYNVKDKKVPSVTTILSATQSKEKQEALGKWRKRIGYEEAARITNQAATRGTEMHYVLEHYMNGQGYLNLGDSGAQPRMMAHTIVDNLEKLSEVYGTEVSLAYEDQWAGSTDLVCVYDGKSTIADFKQSNKPKREEWIEDYYYQIAAYSLAHKKQYGEITQGMILICTKDLLFQKFMMSEQMLAEYEEKWFARVEDYYERSK
jgi:ATP-dependent exoDNAse (exonuclease V) beta subunit